MKKHTKSVMKAFIGLQMFAVPMIVIMFASVAGVTYGMEIPYNVVIKEQSAWTESPYQSYETVPAWIPITLFSIAGIELFFLYIAENQCSATKRKQFGSDAEPFGDGRWD